MIRFLSSLIYVLEKSYKLEETEEVKKEGIKL